LEDEGILEGRNLLVIAEHFRTTESEIEMLFEYVEEGGTVLIASHSIVPLDEKFKFYIVYQQFSLNVAEQIGNKQKFNSLRFCTPELNKKTYKMPANLCSVFFTSDSVDLIKDYAFIMAKANNKEVIMLRYQIGKGSLILSSNPLLFTNYGILYDTANQFIWNSLSCLQGRPLIRTEYYQAGSNAMQSQSPLRYLMSRPPLKWAVVITLITIVVFMIFTAKRKQKPIPIVKPPPNKLLYFVRSITELYLRKNNNADIILKKQTYWADSLKRHYGIDIINERHDDTLFERLSAKTGKSIDEIAQLFRYLDRIDENTHVSDAQMMEVVTRMTSL
jgi:hypothetical protein